MKPVLPAIITPGAMMPEETGLLQGIAPLQIMPADASEMDIGGNAVATAVPAIAHSLLPAAHEKRLLEIKSRAHDNQQYSAARSAVIVKRIIASPHFNDKQKAFYLEVLKQGTDHDIDLYTLFRFARQHPHNRYWVDPLLGGMVNLIEVWNSLNADEAPFHDDVLWPQAREYVLKELLGIDPYSAEADKILPPCDKTWDDMLQLIGDFYVHYLSCFSKAREKFYFVVEQYLKVNKGQVPEKWLVAIENDFASCFLDRFVEKHRVTWSVTYTEFERFFSPFPLLKRTMFDYLKGKHWRLPREYQFGEEEEQLRVLNGLMFGVGSPASTQDEDLLLWCLNHLDDCEFILKKVFVKQVLCKIEEHNRFNQRQIFVIRFLYAHSRYFREKLDKKDLLLSEYLLFDQEITLPSLRRINPIDNLVTEDDLELQAQDFVAFANCSFTAEALAYNLEAQGYFPGSMECLPRQAFGATMLLDRLARQRHIKKGLQQYPVSKTMPFEQDRDPDYFRVLAEFIRFVNDRPVVVRSFREDRDALFECAGYKELSRRCGERPVYHFTARSTVGNLPDFLPFYRYDCTTTHPTIPRGDWMAGGSRQEVTFETRQGKHDLFDFRNLGRPVSPYASEYTMQLKPKGVRTVTTTYCQSPLFLVFQGEEETHAVISLQLLKPWLKKVRERYHQKMGLLNPKRVFVEDRKILVEAVQEIVSESFYFQDDLSNDILQKAFEMKWNGRDLPLWLHVHNPRRVPEDFLATGSDADRAFVVSEILRTLHIRCDIAFGFKPNWEGTTAIIWQRMECVPVVCVRDTSGANTDYVMQFGGAQEAQQKKQAKPVKPKSTWEKIKQYGKPSVERLLAAALLAGAVFVSKEIIDHVPGMDIFPVGSGLGSFGDSFLGNLFFVGLGENKPHAQPFKANDSAHAAYRVQVTESGSLPLYLGARFAHDFSMLDSVEAVQVDAFTHVPEDVFTSVLGVIPKDEISDNLQNTPEPRPVMGNELREGWFAIPAETTQNSLGMSSEQVTPEAADSRLLSVEVPVDLITEEYDLDQARALSVQEKIHWIEEQIFQHMIYDVYPNLDPSQVAFVQDWDSSEPDQMTKYWQHIYAVDREFQQKHPGQCNEIAFTAVQLGRALDLPMMYSSGYLVISETPTEGYTSSPHNQPLLVWEDETGHTRLYPVMPQTDKFARDEVKNDSQTIYENMFAALMVSLFFMYWMQRRNIGSRRSKNNLFEVLSKMNEAGEEISLADMDALYTELVQSGSLDTAGPLRLKKSGFTVPATQQHAVFAEAMRYIYKVICPDNYANYLEGESKETDTQEWDKFLHDFLLTGQHEFTALRGFTMSAETTAELSHRRLTRAAQTMLQLLEGPDHGLSPEAKALVRSVAEEYLSEDRPKTVYITQYITDGKKDGVPEVVIK